MPPQEKWYVQPVFISSTFRDMQAERDHLRDVVFPELEERLQQLSCHLEPVDLRWGVETVSTPELERKELQVLKVCLDEIKRCRPFLVVILGDRYGWVPPERRMQAAVEEEGFAWETRGKSVTALEVEFGALSGREAGVRAQFYFRASLPYEEMSPETAASYSEVHAAVLANSVAARQEALDRERRLATLKAEIARRFPGRFRTYAAGWDSKEQRVTGLEAWGQQVLNDLWDELGQALSDRAKAGGVSSEDEETQALAGFIELRNRGFVGRESLLTELRAVALSAPGGEPRGVCVHGEPGAGKSAVFARLCRDLEGADCLVLAHAAGISPRSSNLDEMQMRWAGELARLLRERPDDPVSDLLRKMMAEAGRQMGEQLLSGVLDAEGSIQAMRKDHFSQLAAETAGGRRVVWLLDALDQFERSPAARHLTWLPDMLPENVRFIATAAPGDETAAVERRPDMELIRLPALDANEAGHLVAAICQRYHKRLHPDIVTALIEMPLGNGARAAGNPLWLRLAVDHLLLMDEDDFAEASSREGSPEAQLHDHMLRTAESFPPGVRELYASLLSRGDERFGRRQLGVTWIPAMLDLLAASRHGLRVADLRALLGQEASPDFALRFAAVRRYFRSHLTPRGEGDIWDFSHPRLRIWLRQERLAVSEHHREVHGKLAAHFEGLPGEDPLRKSEVMFHLMQADERVSAARYYGGELDEDAETAATNVLAEAILADEGDGNAAMQWALGMLPLGEADARYVLCKRFTFDLYSRIRGQIPLPARACFLLACQASMEQLASEAPRDGERQRQLGVIYERLGTLRQKQGDLPRALDDHRRALEISQQLAAAEPGNANWQRDMLTAHGKIGDILLRQGNLGGASASYRAGLGVAERLAADEPANADRQAALALRQSSIGDLLTKQGDINGALAAYEAALTTRKRLAAIDPGNTLLHRNLAMSHFRVAQLYGVQGNVHAALDSYKDGLAVAQRLVASDPGNADLQAVLALGYDRIGQMLRATGDLPGALDALRKGQAMRERLVAGDPTNLALQADLASSHISVGDALLGQRDLDGAMAHFRAARATAEGLAAADPSDMEAQQSIVTARHRCGDVLRWQGKLDEALAEYQATLPISERLVASDPGNVERQRGLSVNHHKIGETLFDRGDLAGALRAYHADLAIAERLAASDPGNAKWQRDLAVTHRTLARAYQEYGDMVGAARHFEECFRTLHTMKARGAHLDPSMEQLYRRLKAAAGR